MKLYLGDIVHMDADAIACPAHSDLKCTPGIREAVFRAANRAQLERLCREKGRCPIGKAVLTPACGLPCRWIIHVVGPGWYSGKKADRELFAACYRHALHLAHAFHCRSIALPLMFSGGTHLPRATALTLVCRTVLDFERHHPGLDVTLVLYKEGIYHLAQKTLAQLNH